MSLFSPSRSFQRAPLFLDGNVSVWGCAVELGVWNGCTQRCLLERFKESGVHRLNLSAEKIFEAGSQAGMYLCIKKKINTHTPLAFFQLRQKKSLGGKAAPYCIIKAFLCSNKKGCSGQLCLKKKRKSGVDDSGVRGTRSPPLLLCNTGERS